MLSLARRTQLIFWSAVPGIVTWLLAIFYLMPKHLSGLGSVMPMLHLIPIFYWGMLHAREMPYWFVFLTGLVMDAMTGLPLGVSSLIYIMFLALLHAQRKYIHKEGFVIKWGYFSVLLLVTGGIQWLMLSSFGPQAPGLSPVLVQWLLTVCLYPSFHRMFDGVSSHVGMQRWRILHSH